MTVDGRRISVSTFPRGGVNGISEKGGGDVTSHNATIKKRPKIAIHVIISWERAKGTDCRSVTRTSN